MLVATKPQFEELVDAHHGELFAYLWRMLGDENDARDCLQDTFLRAIRAYERIEDFSHLRAWLYKIATNAARSQQSKDGRKERRSIELTLQIASGDRGVDVQVMERISHAEIRQAVLGLPARQRAALMMRKYQELEYAEIAEALDCTEEAARANVYQALRSLRNRFKDVEDEE
ncbi:MAG: RNA polymerase sigma factor [Anaerolineales bacterium]